MLKPSDNTINECLEDDTPVSQLTLTKMIDADSMVKTDEAAVISRTRKPRYDVELTDEEYEEFSSSEVNSRQIHSGGSGIDNNM